LHGITSVWAQTVGEEAIRRFYRRWSLSKKKAFTKYSAKWDNPKSKQEIDKRLLRLKKHSDVVRVIAHTQMHKIKLQKKAHLMEIQINGGTIEEKVNFATGLFEKPVPVDTIFAENEMIDTCAASKGHGFEGVTARWGTTRLPRKTHKGLRKVGCIGAWHPSRVKWTVPRAGQDGYFHRTLVNKKIYRLGKAGIPNASTATDLTEKSITPMGGFKYYGIVTEDFLMLKGSVIGPRKRPITLRKALHGCKSRAAMEEVNKNLKFIDTSSRRGRSRFQTSEEKARFFGKLKSTREL